MKSRVRRASDDFFLAESQGTYRLLLTRRLVVKLDNGADESF
jgi:hypothetical protein